MSTKILTFAGSLRKGSINVKLAKTLVQCLKTKQADAEFIDLADYELPLFNSDLEVPAKADELSDRFLEADGFVIVSPEYNASLSPVLKNTLDWVSVTKDQSFGPYKDKMCYLASCSPGGLGGMRGLYHLRAVLMNVGAEIITPQLAVGNGMNAFEEDGTLKDERLQGFMEKGLDELLFSIRRIKALPRD